MRRSVEPQYIPAWAIDRENAAFKKGAEKIVEARELAHKRIAELEREREAFVRLVKSEYTREDLKIVYQFELAKLEARIDEIHNFFLLF